MERLDRIRWSSHRGRIATKAAGASPGPWSWITSMSFNHQTQRPLSYANTPSHFLRQLFGHLVLFSEWNVRLHDTPEEYLWTGIIRQRDNQRQRRGNPSVLVCYTVRVSHYHLQRIDGSETSRAKIKTIGSGHPRSWSTNRECTANFISWAEYLAPWNFERVFLRPDA